jgi:hypothetical protein
LYSLALSSDTPISTQSPHSAALTKHYKNDTDTIIR